MPVPTPAEKEDEFIPRCMGDSQMLKDYPSQSQRAAVCQRQWDNKKMEEDVNEIQTFSTAGGRVLRSAAIVSDVSVITTGEAKGHNVLIDGTTLRQVKACLDSKPSGAKVKCDHWTGFSNIVGTLRDARISGDRVRADLHLLKEHDKRDLILELAEAQPDTFGFSIAFVGSREKGKDGNQYARVSQLKSVDLVDEPAANPTGLFSQGVDSDHSLKDKNLSMLDEIKQLLGFAQKADSTLTKLNEAAEKLGVLETAKTKLETDLAAADAKITALRARSARPTSWPLKRKPTQTKFDISPDARNAHLVLELDSVGVAGQSRVNGDKPLAVEENGFLGDKNAYTDHVRKG